MTEDEPYEVRLRRKMIEIFGPFEKFNIQLLVPSTNAGYSPFQQKDPSRSNSPTTFLMLQNMQNLVDKSPLQPPIAPKLISSFDNEVNRSSMESCPGNLWLNFENIILELLKTSSQYLPDRSNIDINKKERYDVDFQSQQNITTKSPMNSTIKPLKGSQSIENEKPVGKVANDMDEIPPNLNKKQRHEVLKEANQKREKEMKISGSHKGKNASQKETEPQEVIISTEKILEVLTYLPPMLTPPRPSFIKEKGLSPKDLKPPIPINNIKKEEIVDIQHEKSQKIPDKPLEAIKEKKREVMAKEVEVKKEMVGEESTSTKETSMNRLDPFVPPNSHRILEKNRSRNGEKRPLREDNTLMSGSQSEKKKKQGSEAIGNLNLSALEKNQFKAIEATFNKKLLKGREEHRVKKAMEVSSPLPPPPPAPPIPSTKPLNNEPSHSLRGVDENGENGVEDMDVVESSSEKDEDEPKKRMETPKPISSKNSIEKTTPKKASPNKKMKAKTPRECLALQCIPSKAIEPEPAQPGMAAEEFYTKRARDIKHKGDGQLNGNQVERMLYYLECIAYYMMAARHCPSDEQRHSFLRSTSDFVRAIAKHTLNLPSHFQSRITHLLKRAEAVQLYQLYATRSVQVVRNMKIVQQLEKGVDEKPNGMVIETGTEASPVNPTSASSSSNIDSKEIAIPKTLYTLHKQQLKTLAYLMSAQEIWEGSKKDNSEEITRLQSTMEKVTGHRVELDMSFDAMARVILTSTSWLREERKKEEAQDPPASKKLK